VLCLLTSSSSLAEILKCDVTLHGGSVNQSDTSHCSSLRDRRSRVISHCFLFLGERFALITVCHVFINYLNAGRLLQFQNVMVVVVQY